MKITDWVFNGIDVSSIKEVKEAINGKEVHFTKLDLCTDRTSLPVFKAEFVLGGGMLNPTDKQLECIDMMKEIVLNSTKFKLVIE